MRYSYLIAIHLYHIKSGRKCFLSVPCAGNKDKSISMCSYVFVSIHGLRVLTKSNVLATYSFANSRISGISHLKDCIGL